MPKAGYVRITSEDCLPLYRDAVYMKTLCNEVSDVRGIRCITSVTGELVLSSSIWSIAAMTDERWKIKSPSSSTFSTPVTSARTQMHARQQKLWERLQVSHMVRAMRVSYDVHVKEANKQVSFSYFCSLSDEIPGIIVHLLVRRCESDAVSNVKVSEVCILVQHRLVFSRGWRHK